MPSQSRLKRHTPQERLRVLEAYNSGGDWKAVARHNGFPRTTAAYLVGHGRAENLPRGGARATKVTPGIKAALEHWLDECCTFTLGTLKALVREDFNVELSETTISRHLIGLLYTIKQTRIEPTTCNSDLNKEKRRIFAEALVETKIKRTRGRAKKGKRAVEKMPPSKGPNLQIQCAVSSSYGVVAYRTHRGSIKMQDNADFVEELYKVIKESDVYTNEYEGKNIVVVFDNVPAHSQTETLVPAHDDLCLLRLGSYSPMCNPIENCFSSVKAHIKQYLALAREEMLNPVLLSNGQNIGSDAAS